MSHTHTQIVTYPWKTVCSFWSPPGESDRSTRVLLQTAPSQLSRRGQTWPTLGSVSRPHRTKSSPYFFVVVQAYHCKQLLHTCSAFLHPVACKTDREMHSWLCASSGEQQKKADGCVSWVINLSDVIRAIRAPPCGFFSHTAKTQKINLLQSIKNRIGGFDPSIYRNWNYFI